MFLICVQKIMKKFNLYITFPDAQLEKYCNFMRFSKKNQNKLRISRNTTKICRSSICIFIEVSAKKQLKIQFLG